MTHNHAEKFARNCLYNYRKNLARLEGYQEKIAVASSRTVINYDGSTGGKSSAHYVESIPMWFERVEFYEEEAAKLSLVVNPITRLLADLGHIDRELTDVWRLRFDSGLRWKEARDEAAKIGISEKMFRSRLSKIIALAISYLNIKQLKRAVNGQ